MEYILHRTCGASDRLFKMVICALIFKSTVDFFPAQAFRQRVLTFITNHLLLVFTLNLLSAAARLAFSTHSFGGCCPT